MSNIDRGVRAWCPYCHQPSPQVDSWNAEGQATVTSWWRQHVATEHRGPDDDPDSRAA